MNTKRQLLIDNRSTARALLAGVTALTSFRRTLFVFAHAPLGFRKFLFFLAKETRIVNLIAVTGGEEVRQANVYAHPLKFIRQVLGLTVTGEGDKPFARARAAQADSFWRSTQITMQFDLDVAKLGKDQGATCQPDTVAVLWIAKAIIAPIALNAWVSWFLTGFNTTKEPFEREVNAHANILQRLGMDQFQKGRGLTGGKRIIGPATPRLATSIGPGCCCKNSPISASKLA